MALNNSRDMTLTSNKYLTLPVCKARARLYWYNQKRVNLPLCRLSRDWMTKRSRECVHLVDEFTGNRDSLSYVFSPYIKYNRRIFPPREWKPEYYNPLVMARRLTGIGISAGVNYGFQRYIRYLLLLTLSIGFTAYVSLVPGPVLEWPQLLLSQDLAQLHQVAMDTYVRSVCSVHGAPIPCPCGQLYNIAFPMYIGSTELIEDPLHISADVPRRARGVATYIGVVILILTLSERAAQLGI